MNTQTLYLIRGLPGSGKTTLAHRIAPMVFSADDYFVEEDGVYRYRPDAIKDAHESCYMHTRDVLAAGHRHVAVANTFSRRWEMGPYRGLADAVVEISIETLLTDAELAARCVHGVPVEKIAAMRARWEA